MFDVTLLVWACNLRYLLALHYTACRVLTVVLMAHGQDEEMTKFLSKKLICDQVVNMGKRRRKIKGLPW